MNITHFVENLNRGGLERAVIDLIGAQLARGHRCQVICLFELGSLAGELEALGVAVHACEKRRGFDLRSLAHARRWLREFGTDVLHTHNATAHYHAVLAAIGLRLHRTINTRHGMGALNAGSRREWFYRRSMRMTDAVVTVCAAAKSDLVRSGTLPANKLVAIPNGIRVERFEPASDGARAKLVSTLGLPAQTRIIGTVGRLNGVKDHATLIRAFVESDIPDCALVIVGDGPLRPELTNLVDEEALGDRVFLLGDRGNVGELLRGFDVFAMSSLTEGYSIALLEACAVALPIVSTDVGGNAEIVRDGVNGSLVPARAVATLAAALRAMLADPQRATAMGQTGRAWLLREGSVTTMASRYDALYAGDMRPGT